MIVLNILRHAGSSMSLRLETAKIFRTIPGPIVWDNNGLYGIVPEKVVEDAVQLLEDLARRPMQAPTVPVRFLWQQTVALPPAAAEALGVTSGCSES